MGRKKKNTIDYFSHPVKDGTRMFIMEQKYDDKGYVAYYKMLQFLGKEEGHYIDFKQRKNLLYFAAQIRADEELTMQILHTLCEIGAIDEFLWREYKVVWSDEFVERLEPLYQKRKGELPVKPDFFPGNTEIHENSSEKIISVPDNDQSKVKYSKENKSKVKKEVSDENLNFIFGTREDEKLKPFFEVWDKLRNQPKWKRKTFDALQANLEQIHKYSAGYIEDAIQIMKNTIGGNWQGIFPIKEQEKNYGKNSRRNTQSDSGESFGTL